MQPGVTDHHFSLLTSHFSLRLLAVAVAMAAATTVGCKDTQSKSHAGGQTLKIAVIPKGTIHEYWKSIHAGAVKAQIEAKDVQIVWKGPINENDRAQQINVIEDFVTAGVSGIVLAPLDDVALIKPVLDAKQAGIPVLIMDTGMKGEAGKDYVSYVATDNYAGGRKAAGRMIEILHGKGKVLVLCYLQGSGSTMQREQGFLDGMKDAPDITIVSSNRYGGPTSETAYTEAENLLNRYGELDGIFCACEPLAFGTLRALQSAGRAGKVKLVCFDPSEKLIQAMKDGQVNGIVLQDPLQMGYLAVQTLAAHLRGQKVPPRIDTGCEIATPENMNEERIKTLLSPPIGEYLK